VRHNGLQSICLLAGGYKKSRLALLAAFWEFGSFLLRTTLPFLHQRFWKSKKIKKEKLGSGMHSLES
jgi:hypothetical protein